METKHTPGPWNSRIKSERTWNVGVYDAQGNEVAHVSVKSALTAHRRDADARLIAAAPDLLSALQQIECLDDSVIGVNRIEYARNIARAAIAKATGEQA